MSMATTRAVTFRAPVRSPEAFHQAPVLLAEDDRELRRILVMTLEGDGHRVLESASGLELLDRIEQLVERVSTHPPFSLVVSDVHMPGLGGLDVLTMLRCAGWSTPVILLSSFPDDATRASARELGATCLLEKPIDLDVLRATVRDVLAQAWGGGRPRRGPAAPPPRPVVARGREAGR